MILKVSSYSACNVFLHSSEKLIKLVGSAILKEITQDLNASSENINHTMGGENNKFR